ncbi:MAG: hypothetical protein QM627_06815 [Luteolibacter sp.]
MNTPPPMIPDPQRAIDADHLRSLSIGHYVVSGITALFACLPLIHVTMGLLLVTGNFPASPKPGEPDPAVFGWIFVVFGALACVIGWAIAVAMFLVARWLPLGKNRIFCQIVAGIECLNVPLGTILGVFTLMVLQRPSVRARFEEKSAG